MRIHFSVNVQGLNVLVQWFIFKGVFVPLSVHFFAQWPLSNLWYARRVSVCVWQGEMRQKANWMGLCAIKCTSVGRRSYKIKRMWHLLALFLVHFLLFLQQIYLHFTVTNIQIVHASFKKSKIVRNISVKIENCHHSCHLFLCIINCWRIWLISI